MTPNIIILYGGASSEREVSLQSGQNFYTAAKQLGYTVRLVDTNSDTFNLDDAVQDVDLAIIMLHGEGGEDGMLQAQLEKKGIAYLGSDSDACKATFNKDTCKKVLTEHGVLVPGGQVVDKEEYIHSRFRSIPHVLKPVGGGSSVDTFVITEPLKAPLNDAQLNDTFARNIHMLAEELIQGTEITVGVLDDQPLPVILIQPPLGEVFDYENKYNGKTVEIADPDSIPPTLKKAAQQLALRVHHVVGCRHISRTDMIITPNSDIYVLEVNTLPGMTAQSLLPKAAEASGLTYTELVDRLIMMTLSRTA